MDSFAVSATWLLFGLPSLLIGVVLLVALWLPERVLFAKAPSLTSRGRRDKAQGADTASFDLPRLRADGILATPRVGSRPEDDVVVSEVGRAPSRNESENALSEDFSDRVTECEHDPATTVPKADSRPEESSESVSAGKEQDTRTAVDDGRPAVEDTSPVLAADGTVENPGVGPNVENRFGEVGERDLASDAESTQQSGVPAFPYDPLVWENPRSARARRRAARRAARQARAASSKRKKADAKASAMSDVGAGDDDSTQAGEIGDQPARWGAWDAALVDGLSDVEFESLAPSPPGERSGDVPGWLTRRRLERESRKLDKLAKVAAQKSAREGSLTGGAATVVGDERDGVALGAGSYIDGGDTAGTQTPLPMLADVAEQTPWDEMTAALAHDIGTLVEGGDGESLASLADDSTPDAEPGFFARRRLERDARKLERLAKMARDETTPQGPALPAAGQAEEPVAGLGVQAVNAVAGEAPAGDGSIWDEVALSEVGPSDSGEALRPSAWDEAADTRDGVGLGQHAVSAWDESIADGASVMEGVLSAAPRAVSADDLMALGDDIQLNAEEAGVEATKGLFGRFARRKDTADTEESMPLDSWHDDPKASMAGLELPVDHRQFDLPEPIPDRMMVAAEHRND